jgi:hypothetical protein
MLTSAGRKTGRKDLNIQVSEVLALIKERPPEKSGGFFILGQASKVKRNDGFIPLNRLQDSRSQILQADNSIALVSTVLSHSQI